MCDHGKVPGRRHPFREKGMDAPLALHGTPAAAGSAPSSRSHFRHWCAASVALLAEGHLQNGLDANDPFTGFPFTISDGKTSYSRSNT